MTNCEVSQLAGGKEIQIVVDTQTRQVPGFGARCNGKLLLITKVQIAELGLGFRDAGQVVNLGRLKKETVLRTLASDDDGHISLSEGQLGQVCIGLAAKRAGACPFLA
jgi:hypothetical protein